MSYCSSNPNYDDVGQLDTCNDTYSSLSGVDFCPLVGGMHEYQQGLLGMTPSVCNQTSDYARVQGMYQATQIPTIAALQYYPMPTQNIDYHYYGPLMGTPSGKVLYPMQGKPNMQEAQFIDSKQKALGASLQRGDKITQQLLKKKVNEGFDLTCGPTICPRKPTKGEERFAMTADQRAYQQQVKQFDANRSRY
jgi:hypothetical protein